MDHKAGTCNQGEGRQRSPATKIRLLVVCLAVSACVLWSGILSSANAPNHEAMKSGAQYPPGFEAQNQHCQTYSAYDRLASTSAASCASRCQWGQVTNCRENCASGTQQNFCNAYAHNPALNECVLYSSCVEGTDGETWGYNYVIEHQASFVAQSQHCQTYSAYDRIASTSAVGCASRCQWGQVANCRDNCPSGNQQSFCNAYAHNPTLNECVLYSNCVEGTDGETWGYNYFIEHPSGGLVAQNQHCQTYSAYDRLASTSAASCASRCQWGQVTNCRENCASQQSFCDAYAHNPTLNECVVYSSCVAGTDGVTWGYNYFLEHQTGFVAQSQHCQTYSAYDRLASTSAASCASRCQWGQVTNCREHCPGGNQQLFCNAYAHNPTLNECVLYSSCVIGSDGETWGYHYFIKPTKEAAIDSAFTPNQTALAVLLVGVVVATLATVVLVRRRAPLASQDGYAVQA